MKYEIFAIENGREVRIGQSATRKDAETYAKRQRETYDKVRVAKINLGIKNTRRYE